MAIWVGGREREFQLLIPSRRMRFYNRKTAETGNQPTFKASYFGVNIFKQQIILQDMIIKTPPRQRVVRRKNKMK